jgi:mRNA-degrading endonuclease RelE of RelBE toxin-antitoxin system
MVKPESELKFELRDNLAELLRISIAEEMAGTLETFPAETVATVLGLNWQPVSYHVRFGDLAKQILARHENTPIAQTVLDKVAELAANFDHAKSEPLAGLWSNTYVLRIGERCVVYSVKPQERLITVYVIGHDRELRKRQPFA